MFLKLVCLVFIGGAWTLEDKTFAHTGSIFCFDFVAKVSTGSNCSVTKDSTKTILFYDSDNHNVTEEPEYLGRVVNATFEGSGSIQFCLQGLTQTDSGTYTNNCSSSSGIPLTVIDLISDVTIEQPFTKPAIAGNNYSLRCTVAPPTANVINISWLFVNNLTHIVENDNFKFRGDKREVFEILDVKQSFMSAHFMCSAISVLGQKKDSQQYSLYIVVKPEVQLNEKTISAVIGQPFFTDCRATGFPSPSVQWTKNNTVVPQIQVSDSYSILVIQNVTSVTNAIYTCLANVSYGSLILQANESLTLQPYGQIYEIQVQQRSLYPAIASQNYTLVCNILPQKIANDSSVVWRFSNGSTVPENEEFHSEGHYRQFLVIRNVKQSYTGLKLVCVTRDRDRSTVESKNYTLTVIAGPEIQFAEETIYSQSGKPFHKECRALGFPYPVVRWYQEAGQEASQITLDDHHSMLFVNEVGPELRFTCHATVTHGSLQLTINKTFTLKSYDVENSKVDDFFLNDADYKYAMFLLNLLGFCLMILALAIAAILWKWWGNGKRLKEHIKQNSIKLEELKPEKEAKLMKASKAMKRSKKECRKSPQYPHFDDEKPFHFLYDEIPEVRVPTLPKKKNSLMNMKNSYKIITKARCKKQKYRFNDAKRKTLNAPPTLDPQEYSGLKERTSGPNVYDDMNGPTKKNMSTFETADSRLKSSNSSSYLEILADVDKQQTDSVIYSEVKRETAAERDIISEEN